MKHMILQLQLSDKLTFKGEENMDVKEFFTRAKKICDDNYGHCRECPITNYCRDGVFAADEHEVTALITVIENASN